MKSFKYYTIDPPAELAHYVRSYWVFEGSAAGLTPYVYRSMADPCAEMVFHYLGKFSEINAHDQLIYGTDAPAVLYAPSRQFRRYQTGGDFGIFGVYLYPFALTDLFGLSAAEMRDSMPTVADCFAHDGKNMQERILYAACNQERATILSEYLLVLLKKKKAPEWNLHALVRHLLYSRQPLTIEATASEYHISQRQLERKFKTITGYAPKTYARISRFQHALNAYGGMFKSLTEIAYECGYYDQSHFIHDFREFSGYEPGIYFAGKSEGIEYRDTDAI